MRIGSTPSGWLIPGKRDIGTTSSSQGTHHQEAHPMAITFNLNVQRSLAKRSSHTFSIPIGPIWGQGDSPPVMETIRGRILAMATSNRFDPAHIRKRDYDALNAKFVEYPFEPGSVMKPINLRPPPRAQIGQPLRGGQGVQRTLQAWEQGDHRRA